MIYGYVPSREETTVEAKLYYDEIPDNVYINEFEAIAMRIAETLTKKNKDYGDSFHKRYTKHGILSAFIRMEDKWGRFENLIDSKAEVDESIEDTLRDLAGYCILTLRELERPQ